MAAQMMSSSDHRSGSDAIAPLGPAALSILHADPAGDLVQDLRSALNGTSDITPAINRPSSMDWGLFVLGTD